MLEGQDALIDQSIILSFLQTLLPIEYRYRTAGTFLKRDVEKTNSKQQNLRELSYEHADHHFKYYLNENPSPQGNTLSAVDCFFAIIVKEWDMLKMRGATKFLLGFPSDG
ncbi:hypothetical protein ACJX0J_012506, partial [Zea mays]